jgi:pantoate--beta-alanine ligase
MAITLIDQLPALRQEVARWRLAGLRIALVPTMGNLHRGHLELVRQARAQADRVIVSIFVNPLQFGPQEDFGAYPRTPDQDKRMLEAEGVDVLFAPMSGAVYPRGEAGQTRVEVPGISGVLCGASRPRHFAGVATVVCKLLNMVQPDLAVFGEKDFQQLLVIRRMTEDLNLPVEIWGVPIVREPDGLALSSRNAYLSTEERSRAPALYRALAHAGERLRVGMAVTRVERLAGAELGEAGFRLDYVSVRRAQDLEVARDGDRDLVVLAAVHLGRARLIDNLRVRR